MLALTCSLMAAILSPSLPATLWQIAGTERRLSTIIYDDMFFVSFGAATEHPAGAAESRDRKPVLYV